MCLNKRHAFGAIHSPFFIQTFSKTKMDSANSLIPCFKGMISCNPDRRKNNVYCLEQMILVLRFRCKLFNSTRITIGSNIFEGIFWSFPFFQSLLKLFKIIGLMSSMYHKYYPGRSYFSLIPFITPLQSSSFNISLWGKLLWSYGFKVSPCYWNWIPTCKQLTQHAEISAFIPFKVIHPWWSLALMVKSQLYS